MNALKEFVSLTDLYLIKGIFISLMLIILFKSVFKEKIDIVYSKQIIRWILIIYAITSSIIFVYNREFYFFNQAFGPHWWLYSLMIFTNCFLPLLLFSKKLGKQTCFLLALTILINIGWLFETFVIHVTNLHLDDISNEYSSLLFTRESLVIVSGLSLGLISLVIGNVIKYYVKKRVRMDYCYNDKEGGFGQK